MFMSLDSAICLYTAEPHSLRLCKWYFMVENVVMKINQNQQNIIAVV